LIFSVSAGRRVIHLVNIDFVNDTILQALIACTTIGAKISESAMPSTKLKVICRGTDHVPA
jgi:hypothetical protein